MESSSLIKVKLCNPEHCIFSCTLHNVIHINPYNNLTTHSVLSRARAHYSNILQKLLACDSEQHACYQPFSAVLPSCELTYSTGFCTLNFDSHFGIFISFCGPWSDEMAQTIKGWTPNVNFTETCKLLRGCPGNGKELCFWFYCRAKF